MEKILCGFICAKCREYAPVEILQGKEYTCLSCGNKVNRISFIEGVAVEKGKEFFLSTELLLLMNTYAGKKVRITVEEV